MYLGEANVGRLLPEALTADVQAVLPDETSRVCADAAVESMLVSAISPICLSNPLIMLEVAW